MWESMPWIAKAQSWVNLADVACALERYRLANGRFPDALSALEPRYIAHLPHDIIGGKPLKYRLNPDSQFVLYSVGWDEKDDGGVPPKTSITRFGRSDDLEDSPGTEPGDWVWKYPK
jgi:hypothetical protein